MRLCQHISSDHEVAVDPQLRLKALGSEVSNCFIRSAGFSQLHSSGRLISA